MRAHQNALPCAFKLLTGIHSQDREKIPVIKEVLFQQVAHAMFIDIFPPFINQLESPEPCTRLSSRRGGGFQWAKARDGKSPSELWNPGGPWGPVRGHSAALSLGRPDGGPSPRLAKPRENYSSGDGPGNHPARAKPQCRAQGSASRDRLAGRPGHRGGLQGGGGARLPHP